MKNNRKNRRKQMQHGNMEQGSCIKKNGQEKTEQEIDKKCEEKIEVKLSRKEFFRLIAIISIVSIIIGAAIGYAVFLTLC